MKVRKKPRTALLVKLEDKYSDKLIEDAKELGLTKSAFITMLIATFNGVNIKYITIEQDTIEQDTIEQDTIEQDTIEQEK